MLARKREGLSFERLCFAHMPQIRRALGIAGVATKTFAYQTDGAQVDMVTRAGGQDGVHVRDEVVGHAVRHQEGCG